MPFTNEKIDSQVWDSLNSTLILPHFKLISQTRELFLSLFLVFSYRTPYVYGRLAGTCYGVLQWVSFVIHNLYTHTPHTHRSVSLVIGWHSLWQTSNICAALSANSASAGESYSQILLNSQVPLTSLSFLHEDVNMSWNSKLTIPDKV